MSIGSEEELRGMKAAGAIVARVLAAMKREARAASFIGQCQTSSLPHLRMAQLTPFVYSLSNLDFRHSSMHVCSMRQVVCGIRPQNNLGTLQENERHAMSLRWGLVSMKQSNLSDEAVL